MSILSPNMLLGSSRGLLTPTVTGPVDAIPRQDLLFYARDGVTDSIGESTITITAGSAADLVNATFSFDHGTVFDQLDTDLGGDVLFDSASSGAPFVKTWDEWVTAIAALNQRQFFIGLRGMAAYSVAQDVATTTKIKRYLQGYGTYYRGYGLRGMKENWTGLPVADWYVDQVNGDDANDGKTPETAFATIAELLTHIVFGGVKIGLAVGSSWREMLDTSAVDNIHIFGYGSGKRPLLDCSDVVANAGFVKTDGQINVYEITSFDVGYTDPSEKYVSVWEDDTRLKYVASVDLCNAEPGTFYVDTSADFPKTVYVHASDSSDASASSKVYEFTKRLTGVTVGDDSPVHHIHTRRNLSGSGSIKCGLNADTFNSLAEDGNKHNIFKSSGRTRYTVAWRAQTDGRTNASMFVHYKSDPRLLSVTYDHVVAQNDLTISDTDKIAAMLGHGAISGESYDVVNVVDSSFGGITHLAGGAEGTFNITRIYLERFNWGISETLGTLNSTDCFLDASQVDPDGYQWIIHKGSGNNTANISGLRVLLGSGAASIMYGAGVWNLSNSVAYVKTGSTGYPKLCWRDGDNDSIFKMNGVIAQGFPSFIGDYDETKTEPIQSSDNNVYNPETADFRIAGVNYTSFTDYKTNYADSLGIEQNSISDEPLFTDPENGDFSLQAGSPAIVIGAGLSNPDITYTPIPSDETLALW